MKQSLWLELCCGLLILLFLYVGISKLRDYSFFFAAMAKQPLPYWLGRLIAITLPFIEIIVSLLLFINYTRRIAFITSTFLMLAFTIYAFPFAFHLTRRLPCLCGGIFESLSWKSHFYVNLLFSLVSITGLIITTRYNKNMSDNQDYL